MDTTSTDTSKPSIWEFKKYKEYEWFRFLVIKLITLVILYIVVHLVVDSKNSKFGYEYSKLDAKQIQQINRIYFDSTGLTEPPPKLDSAGVPIPTPANVKTEKKPDRCIRAIRYINNEYNDKIDKKQLDSIRNYICSSPSAFEATNFLSDVRLQVQSYFWLTGPMVYFEIIFWSIFGVVCSLLFNLGLVSRGSSTSGSSSTEFDSAEIPSQVAKILYAPICTLVIVLGYNFFNDENIVDISSSKGVIVFAFIGGFYSSRLIAFLDRLKEVLLPHSATPDAPSNATTTTPSISEVSISLELDEGFTPEDLKNDIIETGLGDATVTLQNDKGDAAITATRKGEDQSAVFIVSNLKPGKYTLKALWSKEINGEPVNLEGVQEADIISADTPLTITLKKSREEG